MYDLATHINGSPLIATHMWLELSGQICVPSHRTC